MSEGKEISEVASISTRIELLCFDMWKFKVRSSSKSHIPSLGRVPHPLYVHQVGARQLGGGCVYPHDALL